MGKVFGILLIVGLVWIGLELYTEGPSRAFGGALAFLEPAGSAASSGEPTPTLPQRAGAAVARAHREADERRERMLQE
jgi:hypothetical protein